MSISIENCGIFKYNKSAILRFGMKCLQDSKSDTILNPSEKLFEEGSINVYIPNKIYHDYFKHYMIRSPVVNTEVAMYDFFGNNVGKYLVTRENNTNGGSIEIVSDTITFFSEVVNNTMGNSIIYMNDYYPITHLGKSMHKLFIEKDFSMMQDNTNLSNIVVFVKKSVYDSIIKYADFFVLFKETIIVDDDNNIDKIMVQTSLETLFGRVIKGKPSNISKFIKVEGGHIEKMMIDTQGCNIIHRTGDRIQFISNSNESEAMIVCFLNLDDNNNDIMIMGDSIVGENITSQLNVSITPNLDMMFYHKLFELKELIRQFTEKDNKKIMIENGNLVMNYLLNQFNIDDSTFNKTEKLLVSYMREMDHHIYTIFKETRHGFSSQPPLHHLLGKNLNFGMNEPLVRQVTCAS